MRDLLGITGTPGTGKKTLAAALGLRLGLEPLSLNDLVAVRGRDAVDPSELRARLMEARPRPRLVYGHLLPYVLRRSEVRLVFVLRCDPSVLKARLSKRGYSKSKVMENVEAELIGVVETDSFRAFGHGKVSEVDTSSADVDRTAGSMARATTGRRRSTLGIDWTRDYGTAEKLGSLLGAWAS